MAEKAARQRRCSRPPGSHKFADGTFSVSLSRAVFNDGDVIEGTLTCTTGHAIRLRNVTAVTKCVFKIFDPVQKVNSDIILGGAVSQVIGVDFEFEAGTHSYPFSLQLPVANRPVSFEGNGRKITWKVLITGESLCCGTPIVLASAPLTRTSVYEENLEVAPSAAGETEVFGQSGRIRVDVRLDRVVYGTDTPISVHVFVNNQSQATCRRVKVTCYQVHEYELFRIVHHYQRTLIDQSYRDVKILPGKLHESHFAVVPSAGEHQLPLCCLLTDGELTPSSASVLDGGAFKMFIRYIVEVQVCYGLLGAQHTTVRVPLTLQHQAPDIGCVDQPSRFHEYFCKPPTYDQLENRSRTLSVGSPELTQHAHSHQCPSSCNDCATHAMTFTLPIPVSSSPTRLNFMRRPSWNISSSLPSHSSASSSISPVSDEVASPPPAPSRRKSSIEALLMPLRRFSLGETAPVPVAAS